MHVAEVVAGRELEFGKSVALAQGKSPAEVGNCGLNVSQLIMGFAAIDQDLALVGGLGIIQQLNRSIQLRNRIENSAFAKQQKAMLGSGDDCQLTQRSTMGQLLGLHEQPNTFPNSAHLVSRIAQTQQNSRGEPVVFDRTFLSRECCAIVRDRRMQGVHGLTKQCDCLGVMTKVRTDNALSKQARSVLVIAPTRYICPHRTNIALLFTAVPDQLIAREIQSLASQGRRRATPGSAQRRTIIDAHAPYPRAYGGNHRLVSRFVSDRV